MDKSEQVVQAYMERFPECGSERPSVEEVEELMRQFAPITWEVQQRIAVLFREKHNVSATSIGEEHWCEAEFAVSGSGPNHDRVVKLLCDDPYTCVTPHLPYAFDNRDEQIKVDERILALMRELGQLE